MEGVQIMTQGEIQPAPASTRLVLSDEHPSSALLDGLTEDELEGLGAAATEMQVVRATPEATHHQLVGKGLLLPAGRLTAAGYAVLLAWHRRFRLQDRWWKALSNHQQRMRDMWGG